MNLILILIIGVSLAMDSFSLALSLGTFSAEAKKMLLYPIIVAFFHFIMPLLGHSFGLLVASILKLNTHLFLFFIFLFICIEMILDLFSSEEKNICFSWLNLVLYAFAVSIDSFTVGVGLFKITTYPLLAAGMFAIIAGLITYFGLLVGKYAYKKMGIISKVIGVVIMLLLALSQLVG